MTELLANQRSQRARGAYVTSAWSTWWPAWRGGRFLLLPFKKLLRTFSQCTLIWDISALINNNPRNNYLQELLKSTKNCESYGLLSHRSPAQLHVNSPNWTFVRTRRKGTRTFCNRTRLRSRLRYCKTTCLRVYKTERTHLRHSVVSIACRIGQYCTSYNIYWQLFMLYHSTLIWVTFVQNFRVIDSILTVLEFISMFVCYDEMCMASIA